MRRGGERANKYYTLAVQVGQCGSKSEPRVSQRETDLFSLPYSLGRADALQLFSCIASIDHFTTNANKQHQHKRFSNKLA
jgi:hypothetical protein